MRIELGATIRTKDGHRAGSVARVIWDPSRNAAGDFVASTGGLLGHDVIVSREVLERAAPDGRELVIDLTKDELNGLAHYDDHAYAPPPRGWLSPAESMYATTGFLFPRATLPPPPANAVPDERERRRPVIKKGMTVKDASGRNLGVVDELRIDDMTGELRAIVVRDGGTLAQATLPDLKTSEIPADHLDVGNDEVHVVEEVPGHIAGRDAT